DQLKQDHDAQGATLVPYRSNVVVEGVLRWGGDELGILVEVDSLVLQADDLTRLRATLGDLAAEDRAGRLRLREQVVARLVTAHAAEDRQALGAFVAELDGQLQAANLERLGPLPEQAQAWLEAGLAEGDLSVLAQAWAHPETPPALREQLAEAMTNSLKARPLEGTWYAPTEFKLALGFRRYPDRSGKLVWISSLRAEFLEAIADTLALLALSDSSPFGSSLSEVLERAVSSGDVLRGMSKDHVVRIQFEGRPYLPTTVSRRVDPAVEESPEVVWEQWVMPDGLRVYFYNGLVCCTVPRPESD
ncbi:MAG: hypothetical protein KDD82_09220, partial [Planctomycetes bacterium]|nr:hypothetical protein [Planctomycetota bacterium]